MSESSELSAARIAVSAATTLGLAGIFAAFSGCAGPNRMSAGGPLPPSALRNFPPPTTAFGVGLGVGGGANGSVDYSFGWCDGVNENPSQCLGEVYGQRKYQFFVSHTVPINNGSHSYGYAKVVLQALSRLGTGSYLMSGFVDETKKFSKNIDAYAGVVSNDWNDTIYVHSKTLKKGTPVTIGVQLALYPTTTSITCDSAKNSVGQLVLYSASITPPPSYGEFAINGLCSGGSFEYILYGSFKDQGTTAVGTIGTAVGDSYPLYFSMDGNVTACQTSNYCVGTTGAKLAGHFKFTITSITPGATYRTASGNTYK